MAKETHHRLHVALPDGVKEHQVEFTNHKGERLRGTYVDVHGKRTVMILCHGYLANSTTTKFLAISSTLASHGICSLRFDHPCALQGESERLGPFLMGNHEDETEDIKAAVKYLRSLGKDVKFILGHSKGGINVMRYSATVGDVPNVINLSGRFKVADGTKARFGEDIIHKLKNNGPILRKEFGFEWMMTYEDFLNRIEQPMEQYASILKEKKDSIRLICIHGKDDTTIPWEESKLCAELSGGEFVLVDGDHNFRNPEHCQKMIDTLIGFVQSQ